MMSLSLWLTMYLKLYRDRLLAAIANVERGENLVSFSAEEWHEKYHI
jgi:hypothetical protein